MTDPISLNRVRKDRAKAEAKAQAAENRTKFGRTKAEKAADAARAARMRAVLDGAKRGD